MKKILTQYKGFLIGLLMAVMLVGAYAFADNIINMYGGIYNENPGNSAEEVSLGGAVENAQVSFNEGWAIDGKPYISGDGIWYYPISVSCSGNVTGTTSEQAREYLTACYWKNPTYPAKDLVVTDLFLDVQSPISGQESSIECATTTSLGTTNAWPYNTWSRTGLSASSDTSTAQQVIASTTLTTAFKSDINGFIDLERYGGNGLLSVTTYVPSATKATSTSFILGDNEYIFCKWTAYQATSSYSFRDSNVGTIKLRGNAYLRGE